MLYPVIDDDAGMVGVVTRTQLETAVHDGKGDIVVTDLGHREVVTAHPDETLRTVATRMADRAVDRMPVVDRHRPHEVVGLITLTMLLTGRLRDLREARDSERVLRLRIARPARATESAV
jgi:CBS domain-containing protein